MAAARHPGHHERYRRPAEFVDVSVRLWDNVIPILRQRGAFRTEYTGRTLRDHCGLPRPENPFTAAGDPRELAASGYGIRA
jgi:alkanesulfonate monooxygenase SsuD/methylene tetrahydromethanopterin reductase-like flavin-dependent oxidoreductase (luciferase family)